ncbi:MAG: ORF6N domain-containing protein [Candidatus Hydrogenedentes bacterium]|nr:ORF6N domain-containing protein [Candidatus Hydrogenedentota bacterium]
MGMSPKPLKPNTIIPAEQLTGMIVFIRGQDVVLDADLAALYGVPTKRFNEQIKRNKDRFPDDFMFQLTREDIASLRSQYATSSSGHGGRRYLPYAFTEHGALMAANVLNSPAAVQASIQVVRAFVRFRRLIATDEDLARKLAVPEKKYDKNFKVIFDTLRALMTPPESRRRAIGFLAHDKAEVKK